MRITKEINYILENVKVASKNMDKEIFKYIQYPLVPKESMQHQYDHLTEPYRCAGEGKKEGNKNCTRIKGAKLQGEDECLAHISRR